MQYICKQQTQPCKFSCVATSLAILTGGHAQVMHARFHARYWEGRLSIGDALRELGIPFKSFDSAERNSIETPAIYLCGVPSLNVVGGMHQLVIEVVGDVDWRVYDPAQGREVDGIQRKYYTAYVPDAETEPLAVQLTGGYNIDAAVSHSDLLAWRNIA